MSRMRICNLLGLAVASHLVACSGVQNGTTGASGGSQSPSTGGTAASAGASATGGSPAQGGSTTSDGGQAAGGVAPATGGTPATGGKNSMGGGLPTGGAVASGGAIPSGGAIATGGSNSVGGANPTGGVNALGGSAATGGGKAAGGALPTGGSRATGGTLATGGSKAAGTGGTTMTAGGSPATGGTPSTGACVESKCGSHKWACWPVPTPPKEGLPHPINLTDLGNGTVRDNITCLVWEKANPTGIGNWQANVDRCAALGTSNYGGFSDWRLPTRMEMASIVDLHGSTGFPTVFTVTGGYYATGSWWYETITGQSTAGFQWGYGANGFTSNAIAMSGTLVSRCVRGNGTGEAANVLAVAPPNHYTVVTGEVTDNYTGLVWQQAYSDTMAHADAATYCSTLTINGHTGWRMPTLSELASTVNEGLVGGAIDRTAFPNNPNGCKAPQYWFWASEAYYTGTNNFWGLSYCDGFTGGNVGATGAWNDFPTARVRCVR